MNLTDLQIAEKIKRRETEAYEQMVDRFGRQIYYIAYNLLHISYGKEDIEECTADVFIMAWEKIQDFNPEKGAFKTWLFMLTKYKALDYRRKLNKQTTVSIEELRELSEAESAINGLVYGITPDKKLISREEQERLLNIINGFNQTDRELFIRRYFYDEKINDLADSLRLTRSAIDNRLLRGRKILKEALSYEG